MYNHIYKGLIKSCYYFILYVIFIIAVLVYPQLMGTKRPLNDAREYVPKAKRKGIFLKGTNLLKKWAITIDKLITTKVEKWGNTRTLRNRLSIIKHGVKSPRQKGGLLGKRPHNLKAIPGNLSGKCVKAMAILSAVAMTTEIYGGKSARKVKLDTDSFEIGIDNRCSACISHEIDDFIGPMT